MKTKLCLVLAVCVAVCASFVAGYSEARGGAAWFKRKFGEVILRDRKSTLPDMRQSVYSELPITTNDIVFLGDSILAAGEWSELMSDPRCKNRAIAGSTISDIASRLDTVINQHPAHVVLMAGINDIQVSSSLLVSGVLWECILDRFILESPATEVWMLPVLPVNDELYDRWIASNVPGIHRPLRSEVYDLNSYHRYGLGNKVSLSVLVQDGQLKSCYTDDGLHLNGKGLVEVAKALKQAMEASAPKRTLTHQFSRTITVGTNQ